MKIEAQSPLKGRRILVAASGSIAAVKTPLLVSSLIKAGAEIRCLVTPSGENLVSPLALSTLSRHRCYRDSDQWDSIQTKPLHIALAEWAEIVVVAPLSATSLARWTQGFADGLLASVLLACECPVIAAAAMNTAMWTNPAVQRNWQQLQNYPGVLPLAPSEGLLACDRVGDGRMVSTELIELGISSGIIQTKQHCQIKRDLTDRKLLITAGPTAEAFDPARLITNKSSGRMGVLLAQAGKFRGADVDLVHGSLQVPTGWLEGLRTHPIRNAEQMNSVLKKLQPFADVVAMSAAVADVRQKNGVQTKKLNKQDFLTSLSNGLEHVPDLLSRLVEDRPHNQILLGFAALTGDDNEILALGEAKKNHKGCDLLMANPIDRPGQGFEENTNGGFLLGPGDCVRTMPVTSKLALAHQLLDAILEIPTNISLKS